MKKTLLVALKQGLREIIANKGCIPDQESFNLFHQIVRGAAAEVCAVNERGELLLQYREFTEWPGTWSKVKSWYIPGGLVGTKDLSLKEECRRNLQKDGVFNQIEFIGSCFSYSWKRGEHPFGWLFVSNLYVCRLIGDLNVRAGMEDKFRFVDGAVFSNVPNHRMFQEKFFAWRDKNAHLFNR
jgi:hypothetical protein